MVFPVDISKLVKDERNLFLVQDIGLRSRVLPLFSFNPEADNEQLAGHGTAFRIDPWSRCITAFHVLEDLFEMNNIGPKINLKPNLRLAALEFENHGYGRVSIPDGSWRPLSGSYSFCSIEQQPLKAAQLRNFTELMVLQIRPSTQSEGCMPYFPIDLNRWRPRNSEHVLALGYADLGRSSVGNEEVNQPISQYLYASLGKIIDFEPADGNRTRPWPIMRVDANWPGGMSGGPVFNEAGHVVGVVSTGFKGEGGATAVSFSGWGILERIFGSIDPNNPGWFRCWGMFDSTGKLVRCGQDKAEIEGFGQALGLMDFGMVSVNPVTGEYIRTSIMPSP